MQQHRFSRKVMSVWILYFLSGLLLCVLVANINHKFILGLTQLFAGCPKEYIHIMFYIDSLRYYDKPHYAVIRGLLRDALTSNALSEFPYDWEVDQNKQTASTPPGELKWNMWLGWTASSIMKENQLSEEDPLRN